MPPEVFFVNIPSENGRRAGVSNRKVKSSAGRKPGYKMQAWQKELQLASMRNRDLEQFNRFLLDFIAINENCLGERFFIERDHSGQPFHLPEDDIFLLRQVLRREGDRFGHTLFLYENTEAGGRRLCLKVFDQYSLMKEGKLYPADENVRRDLVRSVLESAEFHGVRAFGEDFLLERAGS